MEQGYSFNPEMEALIGWQVDPPNKARRLVMEIDAQLRDVVAPKTLLVSGSRPR